LIGGSGYGGFLAILLGVLRAPVEDAAQHLQAICSVQGQTAEDRTSKLDHIITLILQTYGSEAMVMSEARGPKVGQIPTVINCMICDISFSHLQVFVTTTYGDFLCPDPQHKYLLTTYVKYSGGSNTCTVKQAMLATLANPAIFSPTKIGISSLHQDSVPSLTLFCYLDGLQFLSGAVGAANPAEIAIHEVNESIPEWNTLAIDSLVSIGAGGLPFQLLDTGTQLEMQIWHKSHVGRR